MQTYDLFPTKANLLKLKHDVVFVKEGYSLLDRKREILMREILRVAFEVKDTRERLNVTLSTVYEKFDTSSKKLGQRRMQFLKTLKEDPVELSCVEKTIAGISTPLICLARGADLHHQFPSVSCKEFDEFMSALYSLVPLLVRYAELHSSLSRLSREIIKVHKRLKALENVHIPMYTQNIKCMEEVIEQSEREDLFRAKCVKKKIGG